MENCGQETRRTGGYAMGTRGEIRATRGRSGDTQESDGIVSVRTEPGPRRRAISARYPRPFGSEPVDVGRRSASHFAWAIRSRRSLSRIAFMTK